MASRKFNVTEIIASINNEVAIDIQRVAVAILTAVVVATPVGNPTRWKNPKSAPKGYVGGHARRNWSVSIGTPSQGVRGTAGSGPGQNGAQGEALGQGRAKIATFRKNNQRIIIQNNVPYITRLNDGHSTAAPRNFVQAAVMVGRRRGANNRQVLR